MANSQYEYKENLSDLNYKILDANGKQLLNYNTIYDIVIVPNIFKDNFDDPMNEKLLTVMYILNNYNSTLEKYKNSFNLKDEIEKNQSIILNYEVNEETYNEIKKISGLKGIYSYKHTVVDRKDAWRIENVITNTNTIKNGKNVSKDGNSLENVIQQKLKQNKFPQITFQRKVGGEIIEGQSGTPENNLNLKLTINKDIEDKIDEVLSDKKYEKFKNIGVLLVESNTGKIISINQKDNTQPNIIIGASTNHGLYPGSIFKIIVEEAGLDRKTISLVKSYSCNGVYEKDSHRFHGTLTPGEALAASCNDIFGQIGLEVGANNFYDNASSQGLFSKVLGLYDEESGSIEENEPKLVDKSIYKAAIGQGVRITPLEAVAIPNTVVNGGKYVKPYIIQGYVDNNNNMVEQSKAESKQVIEKTTASELKAQMINVVRKGTGIEAAVENVEIGGKTGSTERGETSDGWFTGFFKIGGKYYSMVVICPEINKNTESASNTASPVFKEIVEEVSPLLKK
ncbi:MAG: penicillin-binding protein transpeptidase [Clostridiaceae bacterium]|jgi:cell division protein FtsI/penicillin-binding protein 2|nr:penicillin-binding protein transpeptidase [Clostridiaceae bacterium]